MSTYRLDKLFAPRAVALIGASPRPTSPGRAVLRNLRDAGFAGAIHLVNPHYGEIEGVRAVRSLSDLAEPPDLIFANAALHFLPDHDRLFPRLASYLAAGGCLACGLLERVGKTVLAGDFAGHRLRAVG